MICASSDVIEQQFSTTLAGVSGKYGSGRFEEAQVTYPYRSLPSYLFKLQFPEFMNPNRQCVD